jgi:hypothetical protein
MSPRPRPGWRPGATADYRRLAAALVLIFPGDGATIVLTSAQALSHHSGQVSPRRAVTMGGGGCRAGNERGIGTRRQCGAWRTPLTSRSAFLLHRSVTDRRPAFLPADGEVERILEVPVEHLLDPARVGFDHRLRDGVHYDVPFFGVGGEVVWGATAMVLSEFLWLLGWRPPDRSR